MVGQRIGQLNNYDEDKDEKINKLGARVNTPLHYTHTHTTHTTPHTHTHNVL